MRLCALPVYCGPIVCLPQYGQPVTSASFFLANLKWQLLQWYADMPALSASSPAVSIGWLFAARSRCTCCCRSRIELAWVVPGFIELRSLSTQLWQISLLPLRLYLIVLICVLVPHEPQVSIPLNGIFSSRGISVFKVCPAPCPVVVRFGCEK